MAQLKVLVTGGSGFIGIHLVNLLRKQRYTVLNLDIAKPVDNRNIDLWKNISVIDSKALTKEILKFDPQYIVHLSATTTQNANSLHGFEVNIQGTKNLIEIANRLSNLRKLIFTSTQYVNTPGHPFSDDLSKLSPYGFYGQSKLIGEELIRSSFVRSSWTIIRPTTIWGPWHPVLVNGLWKQISKRRYLHPWNDKSIKAYGYVENTAWQIEKLIRLENDLTDKKTFYLADANLAQREWVGGFVQRLTKNKMWEIPKTLLFILSELGEVLSKAGIKFPLYRSRYRNLVTSNPSPLENTLDTLGPVPVGVNDAIDRTCNWLEEKRSARTNEPHLYE